MTVPSATNKSGPYSGNGVTTVFAYGFRILDATHIQVVTTTGGIDTIVSAGAYSVSGVGDTGGGNVTFTTAPATGTTVNLIRNAPFTQGVDLENQGAYYAETIEEAFDLAAMRDQQLQEQVNRAVRIPVGADVSTLDDLIEDIIRLDGSADNIDIVATNIAGVNTAATNIAAINDAPNQAAAAAGSAAAAAASFDSFDDRYLGAKATAPALDNDGAALLVGAVYWDTPSSQMFTWDGTEWKPTFLTGNTVRSLVTATAGQTVFTTPTYRPGLNTLSVFVNGVKVLLTTDYAETTQNSITFAAGLTAGDEVELIAVQSLAVYDIAGKNYVSRAAFIADTAYLPPDGTVVTAGGVSYVRDATATAIPDLLGWRLFPLLERNDVAALLSDAGLTYTAGQPQTVTAGDIIRTRAEGLASEVLLSTAPDAGNQTGGGVLFDQTFNHALPALGGGIVPEFHFRTATLTNSPKIIIMGDSISTNTPTIAFDESDAMWGQIQRSFREANPHLTPDFRNYAWGTRTWSNALQVVNDQIAAGAPEPDFDYGDGTGTWLSYVEAEQPDIVIFAFGMNDRQNFVTAQPRAVINDTRTWAKVPDLVMVTPMVPNRLSAAENISSTDSQEGRYFVAHWMRTWALANRVALLDLNRQYARTVHGIDPRATYLSANVSGVVSRATPYDFQRVTDQDIGVAIVGAEASILTRGFALGISRVGVNSKSELWCDTSGGFIRLRFVDVFNVDGSPSLPQEIVSGVSAPSAPFDMTIFVKDNIASVKVNGATVYEGVVVRHGGRFTPIIRMLDNAAASIPMQEYSAKYVRNIPALTDQEMWGHAGAATGVIGGNRDNHPTSRGAAYVYRTLMDAQRWAISSIVQGATVFPNTTGRNIGIGTPAPTGSLQITKTPIAGVNMPAADANNLVLEDRFNPGMTLMGGSGGAMRYLMGTAAQPQMAGFVAVESTGNLTLRANNQNAATFVNPGANNTAMQLLANIGAALVLKQISVGAADSAGTGFRQLRITN